MAYSDNFPSQRPSFMFDASNAGRIPPNMTYSRASTGTYFGTEKVLSSENLLLQSQTLDTSWSGDGGVSLTGSQTAPDGTSTGWLFTSSGSGSSVAPRISQAVSLTASTEYTATVHIKAGTATHGYISLRGSASNYAYAQIEFASPGSVSTGGSGFTGISGTVTALGSSYYKITLTATTNSSLSSSYVFVGLNDGSAFTGSGYPTWNTTGETMYAWGVQLNTTGATVYDSPTTTQIARSYQAKLQTAASGAARFEHSATDGQSEGILIESQSTNLVTYSSDLTNAFYTKSRASADGNVAVAPDGTLTADQLRSDSTAADTHGMYFQYTVSGTNPQTISFYAKASGNNWVQVRFSPTNGVFGGDSVYFDLANGAVGTTDSDITASIESCGNNGWYRCIATRTALSSGTGRININLGEADNDNTFDGDSFSGVLLWGIMAEDNSSHASSFIATSGSTATRALDSLSVATSSFYTGGPVSIVAEGEGGRGDYPRLFSAGDSSSYITFFRYSSAASASTAYKFWVYDSGTKQADLNEESGVTKVAVSVDTNSVKSCGNGGAVQSDTSAVMPVLSTLRIGDQPTGGKGWNGHVKRIAVYGEALSDSNLQAITS